ncbi:glycosyltransferase [Streptomyces sp. 3MP-14]|uniref:Glycosyltransferase n=1 Tax=Streptomyces mimosae TaxID=2586635 RepID=A0A5N6AQ40_9ACTN|nr:MULTISPECIES: nucleotide disphospho-sugar-binding domain-containing protein [Streptomyces]KAB8169738.1 glycosyltransferase [Streptomyces mimosae]KAB8178486.1 glycosyltransferase [Streptomyces sp. 3MP-14]
MTSFLIASSPLLGHVSPCLTIGAELTRRGHQVRFLTGTRHKERVEAAGVRFLPLPPGADFDDRDMRSAFPQVAELTGIKGLSAAVLEVFSKPIDAQYEAMTAALEAEKTDVILTEMLFAGVYPLTLLPREERPRIGILGISPLTLKAPGLPPYGMGLLPATNTAERVRNATLRVLARAVVLRPAQKYLSRAMRRLVGKRLPCSFFEMPGLGDALFHLGTQGFEYPRPSARTEIIYMGPLPSKSIGGTRPDWAPDLEGRTVVHVTQGTVANADLSALIIPTVAALADSDELVVVSGGGRPEAEVEAAIVDALGAVPANVRIGSYIDYDWLFPQVDILVTNGGYGGVNLALRHGVPLVIAGDTEDKPEVAARVHWSGAGLKMSSASPSREEIGEAIATLRREDSYRAKAASIGAEIEAAPGFDAIEDFAARPALQVARAG